MAARRKTPTGRRGGRRASATRARKGAEVRRAASSRKRITPARTGRGPAASEMAADSSEPELAGLAAAVREAGGRVLGAWRDPLGGSPLLLAALPRERLQPTPFQRDLSPAHARRLARRIEDTGAFLDPVIAVPDGRGGFLCPNGRHRLAAAKILGLRAVSAILSPDERLAFKILPLNTEKSHNLRDRSLEAIRMARELAARHPRAKEEDFAAELEAPELLTLGIAYERETRFPGGAYAPVLRKLDRFSTRTLPASLREREGLAGRLLEVDRLVTSAVEKLRERGFRSPYLRNLVVARINPVRFHRAKRGEAEPPMKLGAALTRMAAAARRFDAGEIRERDLALAAALAPSE